jgi:hypothetical protein
MSDDNEVVNINHPGIEIGQQVCISAVITDIDYTGSGSFQYKIDAIYWGPFWQLLSTIPPSFRRDGAWLMFSESRVSIPVFATWSSESECWFDTHGRVYYDSDFKWWSCMVPLPEEEKNDE